MIPNTRIRTRAIPHRIHIPVEGSPNTIVAAVEYYWTPEIKAYRPHSVVTAEAATIAQIRKHVGGGRRRWYLTTFDFEHSRADGYTYYHDSGGGCASIGGPLVSARRYAHRYPAVCQRGLLGQAAVWWHPAVFDFSPTRMEANGWRVLPHPMALNGQRGWKPRDELGLDRMEANRDPFAVSEPYYPVEGTTEYCRVCDDSLSEDNDPICEHVRWCEECGQHTGVGLSHHDWCKCMEAPAASKCEQWNGEECDHTQAQHEAFDAGHKAGEEGNDRNPFENDEGNGLSLAWQAGHSVGWTNRGLEAYRGL